MLVRTYFPALASFMVYNPSLWLPRARSVSSVLLHTLFVRAQVAVCWFVSNRAEGPIFALINTPIMRQVILVLSEIFRANSMCGVVVLSNSILKVQRSAV